jgi:hypothetical protein
MGTAPFKDTLEAGLVRSARNGDAAAALVLLDLLGEREPAVHELFRRIHAERLGFDSSGPDPWPKEIRAARAAQELGEEVREWRLMLALNAALNKVDLEAVLASMHIDEEKELAAAARRLFAALGLPGLSVTARSHRRVGVLAPVCPSVSPGVAGSNHALLQAVCDRAFPLQVHTAYSDIGPDSQVSDLIIILGHSRKPCPLLRRFYAARRAESRARRRGGRIPQGQES